MGWGVQGVVALLEDATCVSLLEELLDADMPQVQGQLLHMMQQRMQRLPTTEGESNVWHTARVGHMVVASLLRVAGAEQEQSTDENSLAFIKQDGFEEPVVAALNLLRHHIMRRSVSGGSCKFSEGFLQALRRSHVEHADDVKPEGARFMRAFISRMQVAQRYAEQQVGAAVLPVSLVVHAAEMLLEELDSSA